MAKIYYDEHGNPVKERNGWKTFLMILLFGVVAFAFLGRSKLIQYQTKINQIGPYVQEFETRTSIMPTPYPTDSDPDNQPGGLWEPDIRATVEVELTRTAPTPLPEATPTIVPTGSSVEVDTDVIIITDGNGYPVYAGPLTASQWQQCKDISDSGNFWRLVDYQKPICMAALQ